MVGGMPTLIASQWRLEADLTVLYHRGRVWKEGEWHEGGEEVVRGEERGGEKKWTAEGKKG